MPSSSKMPASNVSSCPPGGAMSGMEPTVDTVAVQPIPAYLYYVLAGGGALLLMVTVSLVVVLCCHRYHWATKKTSHHHSVLYHNNQQLSQHGHRNYYQDPNPTYNLVHSHNHLYPGTGPSLEPMLTIRLEKDQSCDNQCWNQVSPFEECLIWGGTHENCRLRQNVSCSIGRTQRAPQLLLLMTDPTHWSGCIFAELPWLYLVDWNLHLFFNKEKIQKHFWGGHEKQHCSSGNACSRSWKWNRLRNTSHAGFLPECGHEKTQTVCNVSLVTACFPLYGCLSCSGLQLDRCQPPNTLSNTGGISTQVQPDTGHNVCCIKGQGCSFGSHPLAFEREWQKQIKKWKTRWRICTAVPDESDGQLHIWHDWLVRFVDCKAIYVFSCSLSGLDKGRMGWDSLDHILENKHAHGIKTLKKKGLSCICTDI